MKKALIASILVSGMWGVAAPLMPAIAQSTPTVEPPAATSIPAKLEVIDAGVEPRRELRFRPVANSRQTMTLTMGMSMQMTMGETPLPKTPIPKMVLKIDAIVTQVDPSGDIHCSFTYSDVRAIADRDTPPAMLAAIQKSLKGIQGIKMDLVTSSTGQIRSKNLILPKNIDPALEQTLSQFERSIEQLSTQFPDEMLGVGAKWQKQNALNIGGIQLNQSVTYEVVKIDATGMTIKTTVAQSSPPQDLPLPAGAEKDIKAKLNSLISSGEGEAVMLFNSLLPVSGKSATTTDSQTTVQMSPGDPQTNMSTKISIDLNISSN
ncbi:hypothetical protein [Chamaesiphon sp.]|uniref:hypothetical protein n=1 Tax=Chamaesiphon sp. TaxID=2814140 RepID=UPI0035941C37